MIEKTDLEKTVTDGEPELTENEIAKKVKLDEEGKIIPDDAPPGLFGMRFSQPIVSMRSQEARRLDKELQLLEEIKLHNKEAASKLNTSAMYQEISDKSTNVYSNVYEAPIEVNNTEAFQRFINSQGGRYGNSF